MNIIGIIVVALAALAVLAASASPTSGPRIDPDQIAQAAFARIFAGLSPVPILKMSWSYGYRNFEVVFTSKAEKESAAALNAKFTRELNKLFGGGIGPLSFRAEKAVCFTYPGYIEDFIAAYGKKEPNQSLQPTRPFGPRG
jgi:hypothetical protein